jgi:outer membrane protein OmpA-like peptidoglycan-associated protein
MSPARALLVLAPLLFALPAGAQQPLTTEQMIQMLKPPTAATGGESRGIKPANPASQAAAGGATIAGLASLSLTVEFATGSAALTVQARQTLDQLGRALASPDLASYRFRIEGHTDTVGRPDANQVLSQRRAETVAAYLEKTHGVTAARLEPVGMGEEGLAVPTPPQTPNAQNRRVKVVNLGA